MKKEKTKLTWAIVMFVYSLLAILPPTGFFGLILALPLVFLFGYYYSVIFAFIMAICLFHIITKGKKRLFPKVQIVYFILLLISFAIVFFKGESLPLNEMFANYGKRLAASYDTPSLIEPNLFTGIIGLAFYSIFNVFANSDIFCFVFGLVIFVFSGILLIANPIYLFINYLLSIRKVPVKKIVKQKEQVINYPKNDLFIRYNQKYIEEEVVPLRNVLDVFNEEITQSAPRSNKFNIFEEQEEIPIKRQSFDIFAEEKIPVSDSLLKDEELIRNEELLRNEPKDVPNQTYSSVFESVANNYEPIRKSYTIPGFYLLSYHERDDYQNHEFGRKQIPKLQSKLDNLGIECVVENYIVSPAFTTLKIKNGPKTKMHEYNNIESDIMQALSIMKCRILNPIPGSEYVGVEIPNPVLNKVSLRELLEKDQNPYNPLYLPFGKSALGEPMFYDITNSKIGPHVLVAGLTGNGKSAFLNSFILGILLKSTPEQVKLILVDPKQVEFANFAQLPHLACPVIENISEISVLVKRLVDVMEERYQEIKKMECKDLKGMNEKLQEMKRPTFPYYVVIMDEYADIIAQNPSVETNIARLSGKARAAGIHLVIATQKPSEKVISTTIKSNLNLRVAFAVKTWQDSKIILDTPGAENLIGQGDMLVSSTGAALTRGQGAFVEEDQIKKIVEACVEQQSPVYDPIFEDLKDDELESVGDDRDFNLYEQIKDFVLSQEDRITVMQIQGEFGIGVAKANKFFNLLIKNGLLIKNTNGKYYPSSYLND